MSNVTPLRKKPRPLRKKFDPATPYVVEREDDEGGSILYTVVDERQESYRHVCLISDAEGAYGFARYDAEQIARGLNLLVKTGLEKLPMALLERLDKRLDGEEDFE